MREGLARFVICTSTLAQGVNLPIRYLLVTSVYQGSERIKVRDFHNLIGRTGRAGMHTEGTILFADPDVYDKRKSFEDRWRWNQVKELLEPANSEPCISSLKSFFEPLRSTNPKITLKLDTMDFVKRYLDDPAKLNQLATKVAKDHADKGFTKQSLNSQIVWKIDVISAVESFLMSQWDVTGVPMTNDQVITLARGTLAYFLADAEDKVRIVQLFTVLAENVAKKVPDANRRKVYGRTLYGVRTSQEIEEWVTSHFADLLSCGTAGELFDLLWPLLASHVQNGTFRKCDKPEALLDLAKAWISGQPFNLILQTLHQQEAHLTWGKTFRDFTIEHVVEMCEAGLAYDGSLLIGAVVELVSYAAPDTTGELTDKLQVLQKMLKYGLPSPSTIALYEAGFSDRVIATDLRASLVLVDEQRRDVIRKIRQENATVTEVLQKYPSYFTHISNDVL